MYNVYFYVIPIVSYKNCIYLSKLMENYKIKDILVKPRKHQEFINFLYGLLIHCPKNIDINQILRNLQWKRRARTLGDWDVFDEQFY